MFCAHNGERNMINEWRLELKKLAKAERWHDIIILMEQVIQKNSDDMWAYISFIYVLMDIIVEPHEGIEYGQEPYKTLAEEYFKKSYPRFCQNPEYLYCTATALIMSPWFVDAPDELVYSMFDRAKEMDPYHPLYHCLDYEKIVEKDCENESINLIVKKNISENSPLINFLKDKSIIGEYLLELYMPTYCKMAKRYEQSKNAKKKEKWQNNADILINTQKLLEALVYVEKVIEHDKEDVWAYIYAVFILGEIIREKSVNCIEEKIYQLKITEYFVSSYKKFSDHYEYIFFMSIIVTGNKNIINENDVILNKFLNHAFFLCYYGCPKYSFSYAINTNDYIDPWRVYCAKEILQNYLHDKFLDAGALRPYIINMIYETSKIVVERYEKEHIHVKKFFNDIPVG